jgi:Ni,Fe-hydrogenase I cytochrome b subunit
MGTDFEQTFSHLLLLVHWVRQVALIALLAGGLQVVIGSVS